MASATNETSSFISSISVLLILHSGAPPLLGIGTRKQEEFIRKAGKQEGNGLIFSCFPAFLINSSFRIGEVRFAFPPALAESLHSSYSSSVPSASSADKNASRRCLKQSSRERLTASASTTAVPIRRSPFPQPRAAEAFGLSRNSPLRRRSRFRRSVLPPLHRRSKNAG